MTSLSLDAGDWEVVDCTGNPVPGDRTRFREHPGQSASSGGVLSVAFSPDGQTLATSDQDVEIARMVGCRGARLSGRPAPRR
jgi:WD40 repeat protein